MQPGRPVNPPSGNAPRSHRGPRERSGWTLVSLSLVTAPTMAQEAPGEESPRMTASSPRTAPGDNRPGRQVRGRDRARNGRAGLADTARQPRVGAVQRVDLAGQRMDELGHGDEGIGIGVHHEQEPFLVGVTPAKAQGP